MYSHKNINYNDIGILNNGNIPRIRSTPQLPAYQPLQQQQPQSRLPPLQRQPPSQHQPQPQREPLTHQQKQQRYNELQIKLNEHRNNINDIVNAYQRPINFDYKTPAPSAPIHRIMALKYDPTAYRTKIHEYDEFHRPDDMIEWEMPEFILTVNMEKITTDERFTTDEKFTTDETRAYPYQQAYDNIYSPQHHHNHPPMSAPTDIRPQHNRIADIMRADLALVKKRVSNNKQQAPRNRVQSAADVVQSASDVNHPQQQTNWMNKPNDDHLNPPNRPPQLIRQFSTTYELIYPLPTLNNPTPTPFRRLTSAAISGYAELNYPYSANRAYRRLRESWQAFADNHPEYFEGFQIPPSSNHEHKNIF